VSLDESKLKESLTHKMVPFRVRVSNTSQNIVRWASVVNDAGGLLLFSTDESGRHILNLNNDEGTGGASAIVRAIKPGKWLDFSAQFPVQLFGSVAGRFVCGVWQGERNGVEYKAIGYSKAFSLPKDIIPKTKQK
jgi:hypothetical protein